MIRYVFYTFRPHPLDLQKFEDYTTLLLPFIEGHPHYAYSIEKDGTPDRHLHAIMGSPSYKDLSKFTQAYESKKRGLKGYKEMVTRGCQTSSIHGWDTRLLPANEDDFQKTLGYIYKDANPRMESNFPIETLTASVEHYWSSRRLDAHSPTEKNWILVTKKNALQHIPDFVAKFSEKFGIKDLMDTRIPFFMAKERYCLVELSPKHYEVIIQTLAVESGDLHEAYDHHLNNLYSPFGPDQGDTYYIDRCQELSDQLKALKDISTSLSTEKQIALVVSSKKDPKHIVN